MKLAILMIVVACGVSYGQTKKGSFMAGGSATIQYSKNPAFYNGAVVTMPTTSVNVSPTVGYFPIDNWAVGLVTSVNGSSSKYEQVKSRSNGFGAGLFTRYYFPFGKVAAFPAVSAQWGKQNSFYTAPSTGGPTEQKTETKTSSYQGGAGLAWFIANNVALEGILFYSQDKSGSGAYSTVKRVRFSVGFQIYIPSKE